MRFLFHLDKITFAVLVTLIIGYTWTRSSDVALLREEMKSAVDQAEWLREEVDRNRVAPPERDPRRHSGPPISRWSDVARAEDLISWHFYENAPRKGSWN